MYVGQGKTREMLDKCLLNKWMNKGMNELTDEQRQDKVWNVWENQLKAHAAQKFGDLLWDARSEESQEEELK